MTNVSALHQNYPVAKWILKRKENIADETGTEYLGVEDYYFSQEQKDELIALGGQWFESADKFNHWHFWFGAL